MSKLSKVAEDIEKLAAASSDLAKKADALTAATFAISKRLAHVEDQLRGWPHPPNGEDLPPS